MTVTSALFALLLVRCTLAAPTDTHTPVLGDEVSSSRASASASAPGPWTRAPSRRPCVCEDGSCGCCTGAILQNFINVIPRQRGCLNVTYDPDDFAFGMALSFNDRVLYKNALSAKNPRPICVSIPRVNSAKLCVRFSNIYFVGRNVHACVDMEAKWQDVQAFQMSFDCIRIGADGVKVVKPEDGAGLAVGVPVLITPSPDEYDEQPPEEESDAFVQPSPASLNPSSSTGHPPTAAAPNPSPALAEDSSANRAPPQPVAHLGNAAADASTVPSTSNPPQVVSSVTSVPSDSDSPAALALSTAIPL